MNNPTDPYISGCLDAGLVRRFVGGALPAEESARVEAHLKGCPDCALWVATERGVVQGQSDGNPTRPSRTVDAAPPSAPLVPAPPQLKRGTTLGRHVLLGKLGEGGMGVVYAAYDPGLDRKVALKLLRSRGTPGRDPGEGQSRLLREAQAMAQLSHPNVISVYDVGTWEDQVFLAMEYVEGQTLSRWLREKPRRWREVRDLFLAAGRGLAAAHAAGLVHRDFKPANVMVAEDGRVRVMDFGLARLGKPKEPSEPAASGAEPSPGLLESPLTDASVVMGTPHYMAPEQREGIADARADQYSFCIALHEALIGPPPPETAPPGTVRIQPSPPATGRVPARLKRALLRGLSQNPGDRFPSMQALLQELGRDPAVTRARWLSAGGALALVAVAGASVWQANRQQRQLCKGADRALEAVWGTPQHRAVEAAFTASQQPYAKAVWELTAQTLDAYGRSWTAMRTEACEATRLRGEQSDEVLSLRMLCLDQRLGELRALVDLLGTADKAAVEKAGKAALELAPVSSCGDLQALTARVRPPADPATRAKVEATRKQLADAKALMGTGSFAAGLKLATEAAEQARAVGYKPLEAETLLVQGIQQYALGREQEGMRTLHESLWAAEEGGDVETAAAVSTRLVALVGTLVRADMGMLWEGRARAAIRKLENKEVLEARLFNSVASVLHAEGKTAEALEAFQKALALWEKSLGRERPETAGTLANMGVMLAELGRLPEAREATERAVALFEKVYGPDHPEVASNLINLSIPLDGLGRHEEALASQQRAMRIWQRVDPETPALYYAYSNMGSDLYELNRFDEALESLRKALATAEKHFPPGDPKTAVVLAAIGNALREQGKLGEAKQALVRAKDLFTQSVGTDHPYTAWAESSLGELALRERHAPQALASFERALAIQAKSYGPRNVQLVMDMDAKGRALLALGKTTQARTTLQAAIDIASGEPTGAPKLPWLRFSLAQALWSDKAQRAKAQALLAQTKEGLATAYGGKRLAAKLEAWSPR